MERWQAKLIAIFATFLVPFLSTLLPIKVNKEFERRGQLGLRIISWLMCFGGGVFFGTYLMDMAPGVREILHYSLLKPNGITYPLPEFLIGVGFFMVLLIEKVAQVLQKPSHPHHLHDNFEAANKLTPVVTAKDSVKLHNIDSSALLLPDEDQVAKVDSSAEISTSNNIDDDDADDGSSDKESQENVPLDHGHGHGFYHTVRGSRAVLLALALSLHRIFEGMSIGLKHSPHEVWALFGAVMCHELVIAFSLGLQFVKSKLSLKKIVLFSFMCSIVMPIGVAIGTLITETAGKSNGLDIANGVLQAISSGTFIYVTFFEILQGEISHDDSSMDKLLSVLLGFGVVAGLAAIPEPLMMTTTTTTTTICEPYISTPPPT